jgi:hypothetical protein
MGGLAFKDRGPAFEDGRFGVEVFLFPKRCIFSSVVSFTSVAYQRCFLQIDRVEMPHEAGL